MLSLKMGLHALSYIMPMLMLILMLMLLLMLIMLLTRKQSGAEKFEEGKNFHLHETHFDIIIEVPPMLTVLGSSKNTPVQMCCVGDHFLGKILPFVVVETLHALVACASFFVQR